MIIPPICAALLIPETVKPKARLMPIINNNDFEKTIDLPDYLKDKKVYDLFNEVYVNLESNLTLNPYKYLIIKN